MTTSVIPSILSDLLKVAHRESELAAAEGTRQGMYRAMDVCRTLGPAGRDCMRAIQAAIYKLPEPPAGFAGVTTRFITGTVPADEPTGEATAAPPAGLPGLPGGMIGPEDFGDPRE